MRDQNRLDKFYDEMKKIHKKSFPDLRFGQLCCNFFGWLVTEKGKDPFFPEEDEMIKYFREYANTNSMLLGKPIETYNERLDFSWEFKNYGIRTVHENWQDKTSKIREDCPIELIKYNDSTHKSCYTLAFFNLDDEGYELHSVGNRLFDEISVEDISEIWVQLQAGQKMLDAYHKACCYNAKY